MDQGKGGLQTADWYQLNKHSVSLLSRQGETLETIWPVTIRQTEFPYSYFQTDHQTIKP
ncbi:hypothetical protein MKX54_09530 [Alkalihalobacillus sp. FSL R5-0424]